MDTTRKSSVGKKVAQLFAFSIGKLGDYTTHQDEVFFFQLNVNPHKGKGSLLKVINEIGGHFLGATFQPEPMLASMLNIVDAEEAIGPDGEIDTDVVLKAIVSRFAAADNFPDPVLVSTKGTDNLDDRDPEWMAAQKVTRRASQRVKRGSECRVRKRKIVKGRDRRKKSRGRREIDDPNVSAW